MIPAQLYQTAYRDKAIAFCRSLETRGLRRELDWTRMSPVGENRFRVTFTKATTTRPATYRIRYQDWTLGPRIATPPKWTKRTKRKQPAPCVNGCDRLSPYASGLCKPCYDAERYRTDPELRERKKAASIRNGKAARARKREKARELREAV